MGLIKWAFMLLVFTLAYNYVPKMFAPRLKPIVEGYFHPKFRKVAETLRRNIESGKEQGSAFAVYHRGNKLIDMWCGYADPDSKRPWSEDTMTVIYSSTKGVAAILIARMVDKGWLDYDKPVATYWPEFAQNGKGKITVAQLLAHEAGVISLGQKIHLFDIREDSEERPEYLKLLEQATPAWKPGTTHGYHGVTFGMFVDTLAQKADPKHRNITTLFKEEIAIPFGIDIHIGLPKTLFYRMARGQDVGTLQRLLHAGTDFGIMKFLLKMMIYPDSNAAKAFNIVNLDDSGLNTPEYLNTGLSSFVGVGTARGLAQLYSYVAMGGSLQGKQLLTGQTNKRLLTPRMTSPDQVIESWNNTLGLGLWFKDNPYKAYEGQKLSGHPGFGGQVGYADPSNQLGVGYVTNYRDGVGRWGDGKYVDLEEALYDCLDDYLRDAKAEP